MVTEEEKQGIQEKAERITGGNAGEYARQILLNGQVTNIDMSPLKELSGELGRIGNNINQIARKANQSNEIKKDELQDIPQSTSF